MSGVSKKTTKATTSHPGRGAVEILIGLTSLCTASAGQMRRQTAFSRSFPSPTVPRRSAPNQFEVPCLYRMAFLQALGELRIARLGPTLVFLAATDFAVSSYKHQILLLGDSMINAKPTPAAFP